ncbi:hypothetical protein Save01_09214 [Streptomyces avermitilis]
MRTEPQTVPHMGHDGRPRTRHRKQAGALKGSVEQGRVQTVRRRVSRHFFGKTCLDEDVVAVAPGRAQPLECQAISKAGVGHLIVSRVQVDRRSSNGRPGSRKQLVRGSVIVLGRAQHTRGMTRPRTGRRIGSTTAALTA